MNRITHWIAHRLGSNTGEVTTRWDGDRLMIGFRCDGCGKVFHEHESATSRMHKPESFGLPPYPTGVVVGPCVCGSWPGGECLQCPVVLKTHNV
jgi:uncharacterized C2H2 Zn-finger protein